jgi:hypothetical protein
MALKGFYGDAVGLRSICGPHNGGRWCKLADEVQARLLVSLKYSLLRPATSRPPTGTNSDDSGVPIVWNRQRRVTREMNRHASLEAARSELGRIGRQIKPLSMPLQRRRRTANWRSTATATWLVFWRLPMKKPHRPGRWGCFASKLVAGIGFEPMTFRL